MIYEKDFIDSILDEQEQTQVTHFVDSPKMMEAVKKVLLVALYTNGTLKKGKNADPLRNVALVPVAAGGIDYSDEQLGRDIRALWRGIDLLESGFNVLEQYRTPEKNESKGTNLAR